MNHVFPLLVVCLFLLLGLESERRAGLALEHHGVAVAGNPEGIENHLSVHESVLRDEGLDLSLVFLAFCRFHFAS